MATVNKNFKIKNGLVVEGATATVNGEAVLTKSAADTTYIQGLVGGVANSQSVANAIVLRDTNASFAANVITADLVGDVTGTVSDISNHDTDALAEGTTNKYFSNTLARDAFSAGTGITLSSGEISVTSGTYDAAGAADTAQTNAQNYADGLASNYDASGSASTAQTNAQNYADEAVANLVNGAPELLDTLNELAAALDDNPNVIADLQEVAAGKQDTLVAGTGIDITGNTISVTTSTYDTYGSAETAQTNAQNYADGLASNYDASGSASTAQTNAQNYADGLASNYDASGSASTAQTNAQNYADGLASNYDASGSASTAQTNAQNYADGLASNYDASGSASTAQTNAQNYADGLASNYDASGSASTAQTNAQNYADGLASNYDAAGSAELVANNLADHEGLTSNVHGVTGNVVGTTDTQDISNKRIIDTLYFTDGVTISNEGQISVLSPNHEFQIQANIGSLDLKATAANANVRLITQDGDIELSPSSANGKKAYYGTVTSGNEIATHSYADTAQTNAQNYADEAVANIVGSAPELLDTLQELATALNDNPNVIADLQDVAAGKQDTLVAGTGIDITGNTISVTSETYDAYGSASTAQTNAQNYADGLASNYDAAGAADTAQTNAQNYADALTTDDVAEGSTNLYFTNALAVSAIEAVTPNFQSVDITWVRREEATWTDANTAGTFTAHTFGVSEGSVKYLVRVFNNGESQVSEVLVTTDSSNNIAVTEYAIIYTSENPLATISADWNAGSSEYRLRVTTANNNSEILVAATLVAYND
jgi:antitoxin component YwqK of YwqJK toxin-antitoxin module